jgi:hypothetical protein
MRVVTGLYDTKTEAEAAVEALEDAEIPANEITLIGPEGEDTSNAAAGAAAGATVGGVGGLLAGLGAFAIPGIGPVVGAGWLVATLAGAAAGGVAGGLIGALTEAGIDEGDAHVYAEGIRRGGWLVSARVADDEEDAAAAILSRSKSINIAERRSQYESGGWTGFDPVADPWEPDLQDGPGSVARPLPPAR